MARGLLCCPFGVDCLLDRRAGYVLKGGFSGARINLRIKNMTAGKHERDEFLIKLLCYLLAGVSGFIVVVGLFGVLSFSISKFVTLAVATIVAVLTCRHDLQIQSRKVFFSPKDIFAFWGIIWLGFGGGILLGLAASIIALHKHRAENRRFLLKIFSDTISIFVASIAYYFATAYPLGYQSQFDSAPQGYLANAIFPIIIVAGTHYVCNSSLNYLARRIMGDGKPGRLLKEAYLLPAPSYVLTIAAT